MRPSPLASFQAFVDATSKRQDVQASADEMFQRMMILSQRRKGIIYPPSEKDPGSQPGS